jgi:preprotein translocase subunit SecG
MEILKTLVWIVEIISAIVIIILVLLQHGKGADAGATFGSGGGSGSLFGASGSSNFLSRTTAIFAAVFFITTFSLVLLLSHGRIGDAGVMAGLNTKSTASSPSVANKIVNGVSVKSASGVSQVNFANTSASNAVKHENQIPQ